MEFRQKFQKWQPFFEGRSKKMSTRLFSFILLFFAFQHRTGSSIREKIWFSHSFLSNLSYLKVSKRFKNFEKFSPSGRRLAPLGQERAGHYGSSERTNFSKLLNRFETFRYDKFDKNEWENNIFLQIDEPGLCWEAKMIKIKEKALLTFLSTDLRKKATISRIFVGIWWNFT